MARTNHLRALVVMAAAALAASLLVAVVAGKPAQASFPGANGLIAFVSDRDTSDQDRIAGKLNDEIYVMNHDGGNPNRLTNNSAIDQYPAVSPDGRRIAFASNRDGNFEIYVMDAKDEVNNETGEPVPDGNGDNLVRLTTDDPTKPLTDYYPVWSPDGSKIAFSKGPATGRQQIWVMDAEDKNPKDGNGDHQTNLTGTLSRSQLYPTWWSPDRSSNGKIAFATNKDSNETGQFINNYEIYVMDIKVADGGTVSAANPIRLTKEQDPYHPAEERVPEFSPDGNNITFVSDRDGNREIYVMNAKDEDPKDGNGDNLLRLTNDPLRDEFPAWSPDGTKLAFTRGPDYNSAEIYVADFMRDASGAITGISPPTNLTNNPAGDIDANWGPDTTKPEITLRTPAEGDTYTLNQSVTADYECADEGGSGLASCVGDVPDGASIDTSSVGDKTFTVTAKDNGDNTNSVTHNYRVIYDFKGFFDPVDNPPTLNSAKAGSAIPVKFSLSGDQGLDVLAEGYPKSQEISCDSAAQVNSVEETATASESNLAYDASTDQYTYVWKTDKAWAGTCRQLVVKLKDGTEYKANFKLR